MAVSLLNRATRPVHLQLDLCIFTSLRVYVDFFARGDAPRRFQTLIFQNDRLECKIARQRFVCRLSHDYLILFEFLFSSKRKSELQKRKDKYL